MLGSIFSFQGRTGRLGYLGIGLVQLVILGAGFAALLTAGPKGAAGLLTVVAMFGLSAFVGLAGMVRRIRDMGWPMVVTLVACFFVPGFSILLLIWPGKPADGPDATVFSDDPAPARSAPNWMQKAVAEASKPRGASASAPVAAPKPQRVSGAMAAASGPRAEFGLRRW